MDWFPLLNSLRIALISTVVTFFLGIFVAYYIAKIPKTVKGALDVILTLPLVLPPTVIGFFILKIMGPNGPVGSMFYDSLGIKIVMTWYSAIFATVIVTFPLMYRTVRGAFESFDPDLRCAGQTLGLSNRYIFWHIMMPNCKSGILAGTVLAFARAIGEYGATSMVAGYTAGRTATIATTVYQLWRIGDDATAYRWVAINIALSFAVLVALNMFENSQKRKSLRGGVKGA